MVIQWGLRRLSNRPRLQIEQCSTEGSEEDLNRRQQRKQRGSGFGFPCWSSGRAFGVPQSSSSSFSSSSLDGAAKCSGTHVGVPANRRQYSCAARTACSIGLYRGAHLSTRLRSRLRTGTQAHPAEVVVDRLFRLSRRSCLNVNLRRKPRARLGQLTDFRHGGKVKPEGSPFADPNLPRSGFKIEGDLLGNLLRGV